MTDDPMQTPPAPAAADPTDPTLAISKRAPEAPDDAPTLGPGGHVTRFRFDHKVFQAQGCYFAIDAVSGRPCLSMPLGGVMVRLSLEKLCREFAIERSSPDHDLLALLERALRYVERVYPGDSIPSEVIDGSASWAFKPEHQDLARGRLMFAVAARLGTTQKPKDRAGWLAFGAKHRDPAAVRPAVSALARDVNQSAEALTETIEQIAREYAYIEALRDYFAELFALPARIDVWRRRAADDRVRREEYDRITALVAAPLEEARARFTRLDRRLDGVEVFVCDRENAVVVIRQQRDLLHVETMKWRHVLDRWRDPSEQDEEARRRETYRFLATHFARGAEWAGHAQVGAPSWGFGRR